MKKNRKAVALRYPPDAEAPFLTASAHGELAEKLLTVAAENNIPVVRDSVLADILSIQKIGTCIPEVTYEAVAQILVFIGDIEKNGKGIEKNNKL